MMNLSVPVVPPASAQVCMFSARYGEALKCSFPLSGNGVSMYLSSVP